MTKSVLVVAAHPDDEVLGCGGTLATFTDSGTPVHVAFLADGVYSRETVDDNALASRRSAAAAACSVLGTHDPTFGDFPDNCLDSLPRLQVIRAVEALIERYSPDTVFTHHAGDLNVDHRRVHEAVVTACRPQRGHPVRTLLFFEVPSSTEWQAPGSAPAFVPNWFVDISKTLPRKLAALESYATELRPWPHPRSRQAVEHLARWRGATIGVDAAEGFMLVRNIT